jgi:ketosteroid isomerase-like protein
MDTPATPGTVSRAVVEAFYAAYSRRDASRLAAFLDDAVEWTISGPVDLLPFCGTRRGKAAVLKWIGQRASYVFDGFEFVPSTVLVDGEQVARLSRMRGTRRDDGRPISFRLAQFIRFRNGKVIEYISIIDSFDAVEQMLGHPLDVHDDLKATDQLVAV